MKRTSTITLTIAAVALTGVATYFYSSGGNAPTSVVDAALPTTDTAQTTKQQAGVVTNQKQVKLTRVAPRRSGGSGRNWETTIEFPDGTSVDIQMKYWRPGASPFGSWERLIDVYDALVVEAEGGDAAAARILYEQLQFCEEAFADEQSYKAAIGILHKTGYQTYPNGDKSHAPAADEMELVEFEESISERYEMCRGITDDHKTNKIQWAEMAAHGGDYEAMQIMAHEVGYTREGLEWYAKAWDKGHVSAADALSIWYRKGAADPQNGQPDYLRSYAYLYVVYKVYENALQQSPSPRTRNRTVSMENTVRGLGAYLTPEQQAEAEAIAAGLLQENGNCCLGGWGGIGR